MKRKSLSTGLTLHVSCVHPMLGTTLKQRYRIQALLGEGSMGVVYRAFDLRLERDVAVKLLHRAYGADAPERFLREARAISRLNHPHIMGLYDLDEADGRPFLVAELLTGRTLQDALAELTDAAKLEVARQTAGALAYAHTHHVVHRDLKPSNIMLVEGQSVCVKLMDFGLALRLDEERMTRSGAMVGTAAYISPEQVVDAEVDGRADLFALGVILYEMFTGARPHVGGDFAALIYQILKVDPQPPRSLRPDLPTALNDLIRRLLQKKPAARPADATEVLRRLDAVRFDEDPQATAALPVLPTGTGTFLFTDIEGSTKLWEQYPDAMRHALARHNAILRGVIESHNGCVFKTVGDGFYAAFAHATDAVAAAHHVQESLLAETWLTPTPLRVRTALHTGEADLHEGDYYGTAVNRCARLLAAAHPGQVLLSATTEEAARHALPAEASLRDLGVHRLRDLTRPERIFQLVHPDLPVEFPSLQSLEAFTHNLPIQLTSFVGREADVAEVKRLLATTRLLTLVGTGGCGKTRLSLQVAADLLDTFADGVRLVELATLTDPTLVPQTAASALGVREEPQRPLNETLVDHLKSQHLLIVLDNCEHLIEACAQLVETLLRHCPRLSVLATSREPLGIAGEQSYPVPSLSLPDPKQWAEGSQPSTLNPHPSSLTQFEAVRLFIERATSALPTFKVTDQNARAVAQICHRLDGIPLAIELAAARVRVLSVEQIAARLDNCFRLLTDGSRTALPRQQTLRALIDWSYDLLSADERALLRRLSVFVGGWTLEAAENVCPDAPEGMGRETALTFPHSPTPLPPYDVLDILSHLVDKSLVIMEEQDGEARYRLLETVRQYGRDRLIESGEGAAVRRRHRDWFLALAEQAEQALQGAEQAAWLDRLEMEHDNLRAALAWCQAEDEGIEAGLRLGAVLRRFWYVRGYLSEGREWLEKALSRRSRAPAALQAKALNEAGILTGAQSDYAAARRFHEESLEIRRTLNDRRGVAASLNNLGLVTREQGDTARARSYYEESLKTYRELGDAARTAIVLLNLGVVATEQGDDTAAQQLLEEALDIERTLGDQWLIAVALHNLGEVAHKQNDDLTAQQLFRESLTLRRELGNRSGIALILTSMAYTARSQGDAERTARLLGAVEVLREALNAPLSPADRADYDHNVAAARAALGEETFAAAWAQGRSSPLEQVIAYALGQTET